MRKFDLDKSYDDYIKSREEIDRKFGRIGTLAQVMIVKLVDLLYVIAFDIRAIREVTEKDAQ